MDSYFLAETLKYLLLTFDDNSLVDNGNFVFTTEGHLLDVNMMRNLAATRFDYKLYRPVPLDPDLHASKHRICPQRSMVGLKKSIKQLGGMLGALFPISSSVKELPAHQGDPQRGIPVNRNAPQMPSVQLVTAHGVVTVVSPVDFAGTHQASVASFGPSFPMDRAPEPEQPGEGDVLCEEDTCPHESETVDECLPEDLDEIETDDAAAEEKTEPIQGLLTLADPELACEALQGEGYANTIVLIKRGVCRFAQKVVSAQVFETASS